MTASGSGPGYYERTGKGYRQRRLADPRVGQAIQAALGEARTVLNVGAGTGSYEPTDREVVALDPSAAMLAQRTSTVSCVRGRAEALPFRNGTFDAAMAILTVHHWSDWRLGVREMQRVAGRSVMLTFDTEFEPAFWLWDYFPEILARDRKRMPLAADLQAAMGAAVSPVPVPADCTDGFLGAFWRQPEQYLRSEVRAGSSGFALLSESELERGLTRLERDIHSGAWQEQHGRLLGLDELDMGYLLLIGEEAGRTEEGGLR